MITLLQSVLNANHEGMIITVKDRIVYHNEPLLKILRQRLKLVNGLDDDEGESLLCNDTFSQIRAWIHAQLGSIKNLAKTKKQLDGSSKEA
jgi:hypothetical protein